MAERLYLVVPYAEKDAAKALGARWDPMAKQWFAPPGADPAQFKRWAGAARAIAPRDESLESMAGALAPAPGRSAVGASAHANGQLPPSPPSAPRPEPRPAQSGGPPALAGLAQSNPMALSKALARAHGAILSAFPAPLWIQAEVESVRRNSRSGHWYFELAERDASGVEVAKASARVWSSDAPVVEEFESQAGEPLRAGLRVLALAQIDFSPQYGLGMRILRFDPSWTLGEMQKKLMQIRQALREEGVAERNRSLPAPQEFTRVALIAPAQAAGLGDFMADARRLERFGLCSFELFEAPFEGRPSLEGLLRAFERARAAHQRAPFDALALIRGGGATASLNWLNELELARAVALFPAPVIAGIGHERDKTALDEVARLSLDTPSKVIGLIASAIVGNAQQASADFSQATALAASAVQRAGSAAEEAWAWVRSESARAAQRAEASCQALAAELAREARFAVKIAEERAQSLSKEILGLGPRQTLARGYAMARAGGPEGPAVSSAAQARGQESLWLSFADGGVPVAPIGEERPAACLAEPVLVPAASAETPGEPQEAVVSAASKARGAAKPAVSSPKPKAAKAKKAAEPGESEAKAPKAKKAAAPERAKSAREVAGDAPRAAAPQEKSAKGGRKAKGANGAKLNLDAPAGADAAKKGA
jgi:exodeoxyribonuclease VII large subunit